AGLSVSGRAFSALNTEAIFVNGGKPSDTAPYVKEFRAATKENGRDSNHINVFPQTTPILARTRKKLKLSSKIRRLLLTGEVTWQIWVSISMLTSALARWTSPLMCTRSKSWIMLSMPPSTTSRRPMRRLPARKYWEILSILWLRSH
ncbi:hypothetical protein BJ878DRAFT_418904, partial [Calycina marina]